MGSFPPDEFGGSHESEWRPGRPYGAVKIDIVHYMARIRLEEGGVVRAVLDMCGALAARGHRVTLLTFDSTDVPRDWADADGNPTVITLQRPRGVLPRLGGAARKLVREVFVRADVVHLHVPWDLVCRPLARLAREARVPYFISIHGMLDDWCMRQKSLKKRVYLAMGGRGLLERAEAVHCTARAEAEQSSRWFPRGRAEVVPLLFDLAEYEQLPGPEIARRRFAAEMGDDGEPVVLFVSRLHPKKRLDVLIEAAARLRDDGLACRFLIAGTGEPEYQQQLRGLVQQRALGDRVHFVGFVSGRDKLSLYQAADVFVLPTFQENWGFVLIESLACGTPLVTTRGVDIWSELESSGGAVIVEATAAATTAAISELLGDRERLNAMGPKGRAWVLDNLSVDGVLDRYEQLYRRVPA